MIHPEGGRLDPVKLQQGVKLLLQGMGVDLKDSHYKDTPKRVAKMYMQLLTPQVSEMTSFESDTTGMIVLRNHRVFALCPHHLMPVELNCCVAYIPRKKMLGLSKLARIVERQLTRPITQEMLGELVADDLFKETEPEGCSVVLSGEHGCMKYRGIETTGDVVHAVHRGIFMHSATTREEFFRIIGRPR